MEEAPYYVRDGDVYCRRHDELYADVVGMNGISACLACRAEKKEQRRMSNSRPRRPDHVALPILAAQGGGCGICGKTAEAEGKALADDHNHITGLARGFLCWRCNTSLGMFKGDEGVQLLEAAVQYLKKYESIGGGRT